MKVALIHDWLVTIGGAEKVLRELIYLFPDADLFSVIDFLSPKQRESLFGKESQTTFIQHLPFAKKNYRTYFPLMPLAIGQLNLKKYDLIISSSSSVAKGVKTYPSQTHICYCHTPARYLWDMQEAYLAEKGMLARSVGRYVLDKIKAWDYKTASKVDHFIANSQFVAERIKNFYGRDADVAYPPVDMDAFTLCAAKEDFYLTLSRLVPYKKIRCMVEAFNQLPDKKLVIIGDGPELTSLKKRASCNTIFLGFQPLNVARSYMQKAKAFLFAAKEDFGIAPVEALACGTPVIAYGEGGVLETVQGLGNANPTGCFFDVQSQSGILEGIHQFEANSGKIYPQACRERAALFSKEKFREKIRSLIFKNINKGPI